MYLLLSLLAGGNRRTIGKIDEAVNRVLKRPHLFEVLFERMLSDDPIIRMRSADAAEKITSRRPEHLASFKGKLIHKVA